MEKNIFDSLKSTIINFVTNASHETHRQLNTIISRDPRTMTQLINHCVRPDQQFQFDDVDIYTCMNNVAYFTFHKTHMGKTLRWYSANFTVAIDEPEYINGLVKFLAYEDRVNTKVIGLINNQPFLIHLIRKYYYDSVIFEKIFNVLVKKLSPGHLDFVCKNLFFNLTQTNVYYMYRRDPIINKFIDTIPQIEELYKRVIEQMILDEELTKCLVSGFCRLYNMFCEIFRKKEICKINTNILLYLNISIVKLTPYASHDKRYLRTVVARRFSHCINEKRLLNQDQNV